MREGDLCLDGKHTGEHQPHDRPQCGQYHHGRYHACQGVHLSEQDERCDIGVCEMAWRELIYRFLSKAVLDNARKQGVDTAAGLAFKQLFDL